MAFTDNCGIDSSSPFCVCTDYYGNILPEYKTFSEATQTYSCCSVLNEFSTFSGSLEPTGTDLVSFAKQSNTSCSQTNFYNGIATNEDLRQKTPLIYYQALLNASLFSNFNSTSTFDDAYNTISCTSGVPYFVSYPNYINNQNNYKVLCTNKSLSDLKDIKFLGSNTLVPYSLYYIRNSDGTNCLTGPCKPKFPILSYDEYNIGEKFYSSKGNIDSESILLKWWFWFIIMILLIVSMSAIYLFYYGKMNTIFNDSADYLNNVKKGLGDTAKKHSKKVYNSHFHINT